MGRQPFQELQVWQRSRDLAVKIYFATRQNSFQFERSLADQMRRAAVSIPSNIAEGNERGTDREAARFFYIARGSSAELRTQLEIAHLTGYLDNEAWQQCESECAAISRMLSALIRARSSL